MEAATLSNVIIEQQLTVGLLRKLFRIENAITQPYSSACITLVMHTTAWMEFGRVGSCERLCVCVSAYIFSFVKC